MECRFGKVMNVINSCETDEQLIVADRYLRRALEKECISYFAASDAYIRILDKWSGDIEPPKPPPPPFRSGYRA